MNFKFIFYATTLLLYVGHAAAHDYLGKGIYIHDYDLLSDDLSGGYPIYNDLSPQCVKTTPMNTVDYNADYFQNTEDFYRFLGTQNSISGEIQLDFTLGRSLDVTTQDISGNKRTVQGVTHSAISTASNHILLRKCASHEKFDDHLIRDFIRLDSKIHDPKLKSNWYKYHAFLKKYGSHVVQEVVYGASVYEYTFSDSSHKYSASQLHMKTCGSAGIPHLGKIEMCNGFTKKERESVSKLEMSERFIARGGTDKSRTVLLKDGLKDRKEKIIEKFLLEANNGHQPIQYKFKPIWEVLQEKYLQDSKHTRILLNMEGYYTGYLSYGCQHLTTNGPFGAVDLQKFEYSDQSQPDYPMFQCSIAPYGCYYDRDCHYISKIAKCDCSGNTCIKHHTHKTNTGEERTVAEPFIGKGYRNNPHIGCMRRANLKCRCRHRHDHKPRPWTVVWKSSEKHGNLLSVANFMMQPYINNTVRSIIDEL